MMFGLESHEVGFCDRDSGDTHGDEFQQNLGAEFFAYIKGGSVS